MLVNRIGFVRKDNRKYEKRIEKICKFIRKIFLKVKIEYIQNDVMFLIPNYKENSKFILKIISQKIKKYVDKIGITELIFEDNLNYLRDKLDRYFISDGKLIMKKNLIGIFEYIFKINKQNTYIINELIEKFKTVNIITENIKKYRRMENYWFNEGILITVSNNKRKSLKNAKYIINIDFDKNKILMYNINSNSIIINLSYEDIKPKSNFNGVLINNIELKIDKNKEDFINEFYGNINKKIFLETIIKKNIKELDYIKKINYNYNVKISELIGTRGRLENNEFLV